MYIIEATKIAWSAIKANKTRSILTTLGIIIGISAVIAMVSIGQGAQSSILEQVQGLGANSISVIPVGNFMGPTNQASIRALQQNRLEENVLKLLSNKVIFPEVIAVDPQISGGYDVTYRSNSRFVTVLGITPGYYVTRDREITEGRGISDRDVDNQRKVAVIGPRLKSRLFGESSAIGKNIKINNSNYSVIGIMEETGSETDDGLQVPVSTAQSFLVGTKGYSQIGVKVESEDVIDSVATRIENELLELNNIRDAEKANFTVFTSKDILSLTESITGIFTTLLAGIAGISLVVGGIGIMNIMLVSVSERTKEIGLRKAVGAKQGAILSQFLIEAILLTLIGGVIGIVLGISIGLLFGAVSGIAVGVSPQAIVLATSVSGSIGLVFGYYPAYRAAKLNPIDALRYD